VQIKSLGLEKEVQLNILSAPHTNNEYKAPPYRHLRGEEMLSAMTSDWPLDPLPPPMPLPPLPPHSPPPAPLNISCKLLETLDENDDEISESKSMPGAKSMISVVQSASIAVCQGNSALYPSSGGTAHKIRSHKTAN